MHENGNSHFLHDIQEHACTQYRRDPTNHPPKFFKFETTIVIDFISLFSISHTL